jgi:Tfp pilus assembly protein PilZ
MSAATNRRRFPRVRPKQLATRIRAGEELHIGLGIENISMGGVFVRCNTPMKVGRAVTLEVMRPGTAVPLEIEGKVTSSVSLAAAAASHRSAGMGISFDALPPHVEQRLEGLIGSIDPSVIKKPAGKREVKAPVLIEKTEITASHQPPAGVYISDKTYVPIGQSAMKTEMVRSDEHLRRDLIAAEQKIAELEAENKKLRQRLLNYVNNGS